MQLVDPDSSKVTSPVYSQTGMERYVLRTRRDILPVFAVLARAPIPVKVTIAQLGNTISSRLIAFNPAFEELVFDATGVPGVERLDGSAGLSAEAQIDAAWFRFEAEHVEVAKGYAVPAFRARLPTTLARFQRRDSVRYPVPALNPPVCDIRVGAAEDRPSRLRAIDISNSGIALLIDDPRLNIVSGSTLVGALLHLPDIGAIATDLLAVYLAPFGEGDQRRLGCRFTNLRATSLDHLQRYVARLERARLEARSEG